MHEHSDYLRDQATKYWELAAQADDPVAKQELCELARVCEEVADDMDDRRVSGYSRVKPMHYTSYPMRSWLLVGHAS